MANQKNRLFQTNPSRRRWAATPMGSEGKLIFSEDGLVSIENQLLRRMVSPNGRHFRTLPTGVAAFGTDVGATREENQDRLCALLLHGTSDRPPRFYAALADGMGGMLDGAGCASLTLASVADSLIGNQHLPLERGLEEAARYANKRVYSKYGGRGGATLTLVALEAEGAIAGLNVGDSRIYARRPNGWGAETVDDTLEARFGSDGRGLIQFVGLGEGLRPHLIDLPINSHPIYLTSDGVHFVEQTSLFALLEYAPDAKAGAERCIAFARWVGSPDNATVLGIQPEAIISYLRQVIQDDTITLFGLLDTVEWARSLAWPPSQPPVRNPPEKSPAKAPRTQRSKSRGKLSSDGKSPQLKIEVAIETPEEGYDDR